MNFCPREFNSDMADPRNLAYCHEIQRQDGAACRKKRCAHCVVVEKVEPERTAGVQGSLFFAHHANKTEQNASVVVAESSEMWLDNDAERLGWLPGVKDRSARIKVQRERNNEKTKVYTKNRRHRLNLPNKGHGVLIPSFLPCG